ncbi:BTB/POZ domain-containing protein [Rhizophagus irregularis DAOM 181602=DAOM 197198]|nr:BTB/POZ domain-containing protein [Rhizophagus irregularis DAOM 181602=DAOM 197198]
MPYKFESEVLKALEKLLKTETNYDVIIHVGKESDTKEFHAHSGFLCCRSDYFNSILSTKDTIKKDGKYVINKPNITPQAFDVIIKYFYTGHVDMTNNTGVEILNMMTAFDDLKLNQLIELAEDFLIDHHQNFLQNDPIKILQMVYSYKIFNNIQRLCLQNIYSKPNILFNSVKFVNLPAPLLEIILKQDDLILDEIEIWENLIKWGLAKDKILDEHVSKWNREKFNIFERILHNFMPLIRFYDISSEDYFNKVRPYEQILSKELREDILKFHMVPGFKPSFNNYTKRRSKKNIKSSLINTVTVDSLFINKEHVALFANWINWIERKDNYKYNNNISYDFNLILRGSRDGFDPKSFHNKCDNKGATITVIKIKNPNQSRSDQIYGYNIPIDWDNQIIGGYNPLDWSGRGRYSTPDSFLFSFNDNRNVESGIISRPININSTVISDPNWGPIFGAYTSYEDSHDLCMKTDGQWSSYPNSYTDINIPRNYFDIVDYEIFQVKKRIT